MTRTHRIPLAGTEPSTILKIYALSGTTNDWNEEVITHQGLNKNTCNNFIDIEIERIYKYIKKKDILPISSIQTYLLNRWK